MTDDQWLGAIARYSNSEREDWTTMRGGAHELSSMLQGETAADPDRFARLALRLTAGTNPDYLDGILMGLGNVAEAGSPALVFNAIRHIASLGHSENDRWL